MKRRSLRIGKPAAVLFAAAVAVLSCVLPASADITPSSVKVTDPTQSEILAGSYDSDGTPSGFKHTFKGTATTNCTAGWQSIKFTVSGPEPTETYNVPAPSSQTWTGSALSQWDTQDNKNGIYTIRLDVVEKPKQGPLDSKCNSQAGSHYVTAKLANPATAPDWQSAPAKAGDGSASVTLRWKKNGEPDVLEYRIVRTDPGGATKTAYVSAGSPGAQGCALASNVYTCEDTAFPSDYTGTYSYGIVAVRERPAYNSSEDDKVECSTVSKPCVASKGSSIGEVSLVAPTPTPTPTDQPSTPPQGGGNTPGTPSSRPNAGGNRPGGTSVLSFGGGGSNPFFSGTYSETLPYTPRSFILGGGSATSSPQAEGYQGEVFSETPPDYRTIMLPVAGGLLAFLSAAHVRRLLLHL